MAKIPRSAPTGVARWWSRTRGLPRELHEAFVASLALPRGAGVPRILAWAQTSEGVCIGGPSLLSYGNTAHWTHVGWHQIERGGWNAETSRLRWTLYGGEQGFVELAQPGRVPELFRERVAASIVLEKVVALRGSRGVTIVGRRDLCRIDAAIIWHTTLGPGLSWDTEGVREVTDAALAQVQAEYDIA